MSKTKTTANTIPGRLHQYVLRKLVAMLPMEARRSVDPDGQQLYAPFRNTVFTHREDEIADGRGPGALFREEWNSLAGNARRFKPLTLYRTERDINPTKKTTVQQFYDSHEISDLSSQLKWKGNAVTALQSHVPRFKEDVDTRRGPGSYSSDQYHAAFPTLFNKITPHTVHLEKVEAKRSLAATFGIVPAPTAPDMTRRELPRQRFRSSTLNSPLEVSLGSTRLAPALTPRNAYQNPTNRQFILAMRPPESASSSRN